eukprot:1932624-Ditylum_brightwellii.AAC.1
MYAKDTEHIAYGLVDSLHYPVDLRISSSYQTYSYSVISLYHFRKVGHEFCLPVKYYFRRPVVL